MTATPGIDPALTRTLDPGEFLHDQLAQASPDLMREPLATFVNALLGADADAICGAAYYNRTPERVNSRNGYRHRDLDTRVGTFDVASPSSAGRRGSPVRCRPASRRRCAAGSMRRRLTGRLGLARRAGGLPTPRSRRGRARLRPGRQAPE